MAATTTTYHSIPIDGVQVFYREAGPGEAPVILLLLDSRLLRECMRR